MPDLQPLHELEDFYKDNPDPWRFDETPDDQVRVARLLALLPNVPFRRTLDIGCGNGFLTIRLPGDQVTGVDISSNALRWARLRADRLPNPHRFVFKTSSVFDLESRSLGRFDLIAITGVLYPQYVGSGFSVVREVVDDLLNENGVLATVHIDEWSPWRFPYTLVAGDLSKYRGYTHRIEIFTKVASALQGTPTGS